MKIPRLKGNASQKTPPSIIVHKNAYEITADICGFMYMSLIEYKDRLARFSCHKLEQYANSYGVMIEVIDEQPSKGLEAELVDISYKNGLYEVTVTIQGQDVPVYITNLSQRICLTSHNSSETPSLFLYYRLLGRCATHANIACM